MQIKFKKLTAMTLVEVLLVLTIMGTITALTLPSLKKHSQKTEYAKLAQLGYTLLEQAFEMAEAKTEKDVSEWSNKDNPSSLLGDELKDNFVAVKSSLGGSAVHDFRKFKDNTSYMSTMGSYVILPNGIMIYGLMGGSQYGSIFIIDVNNTQPPNMEGVDVFVYKFIRADANCNESTTGNYKLCPVDHAKNLVEDGWNITYW